jgi:HD-GYP domain-containing protein (c-di-GMP phosphodiesterase class II)
MMYDNLSNLELVKVLESLESHGEDAIRKRIEAFIRNEKKLQGVLWEIIQLLVSIVERKDPYASYHHQEMCILACYIAEKMGMSKEQVDVVCMAGMLHDIGKINLPDELFRKLV